jgi:hypothetical protein
MELSPSDKLIVHSASQENSCLLWDPKIHYRVHKTLPPVHILHQTNPVHTLQPHFPKTHFNTPFPRFTKFQFTNLRFSEPCKLNLLFNFKHYLRYQSINFLLLIFYFYYTCNKNFNLNLRILNLRAVFIKK